VDLGSLHMQIVGEWKMQFGRCMDESLVIGSFQ